MKHRNFNTNYHLISNPTFENENTGYFTWNGNAIYHPEKDFLFDWINPYTKEHIIKVLPFKYVIDCMKNQAKSVINQRRQYAKEYNYYRISYKDIMNYHG